MKHIVVSLACLATCLALCSSAVAATLQWSYSLGVNGFCYQTVADGNGGCAIVTVEAGAYKLIWFDKKGAVRYSKSGITDTVPVISSCEKNLLVFCHSNGVTIQTVLVDKNASEHITTAANTHYLAYSGVALGVKPQRLSDRKGYFVEKVDLPANTVTLQRYSYK